jgi:hypothetical protein
VQLTHLGSRGIVMGKWVALLAQMLLLAVSMLPYLLLLYFVGIGELGLHLTAFGLSLGWGAGLCAFAIAMSPAAWWWRLGALGGMMFVACVTVFGLCEDIGRVGNGLPLAILVQGCLATLFALVVGMRRVAAEAEETAWVLRSVGVLTVIAVLLAAPSCGWGLKDWGFFVVCALPTWVWLVLELSTETTSGHLLAARRWMQRPVWVRWSRHFLATGWWSGTLLVIVVFGCALFGLRGVPFVGRMGLLSGVHLLAWLLLWPMATCSLLPKKLRTNRLIYIVAPAVFLAVGFFLEEGISYQERETFRKERSGIVAHSVTPFAAWVWAQHHSHYVYNSKSRSMVENPDWLSPEMKLHLGVSGTIYALLLLLLWRKSRPEARALRAVEREALVGLRAEGLVK